MVFHAAACLRSRQFLSHFFLSFSLVSRYIYSRAYQLSSFSEFFLILLHQVMPKHARVRITDAKLNMHLIIRQRLFAFKPWRYTYWWRNSKLIDIQIKLWILYTVFPLLFIVVLLWLLFGMGRRTRFFATLCAQNAYFVAHYIRMCINIFYE